MKEGRQETEAEGLHAKFHVNLFIVSASGGRKSQFWANFDFWASCTDPLLPMKVKFGLLKQTDRLHLQAEFHLNMFIVSPSGGQKPQFLANCEFWGAPVPAPFY